MATLGKKNEPATIETGHGYWLVSGFGAAFRRASESIPVTLTEVLPRPGYKGCCKRGKLADGSEVIFS